jgi:hypothetical protein
MSELPVFRRRLMLKTKLAITGVALAVLAAGCATSGGVSDEDLASKWLQDFKGAIESKALDSFMEMVSADFAHDGYEYSAENKAQFRAFNEAGIAEGTWDGVDLDLSGVEIGIDGNTATLYPIGWTVSEGSVTIEAVLKKEGAVYRLIDLSVEGL